MRSSLAICASCSEGAGLLEDRAGVHHRLVEHQAEEVVAEVVVRGDVAPCARRACCARTSAAPACGSATSGRDARRQRSSCRHVQRGEARELGEVGAVEPALGVGLADAERAAQQRAVEAAVVDGHGTPARRGRPPNVAPRPRDRQRAVPGRRRSARTRRATRRSRERARRARCSDAGRCAVGWSCGAVRRTVPVSSAPAAPQLVGRRRVAAARRQRSAWAAPRARRARARGGRGRAAGAPLGLGK